MMMEISTVCLMLGLGGKLGEREKRYDAFE